MKNFKRMGVINITPDSFSDAGESFDPQSIKDRLIYLTQFDLVDIGAESTNPRSSPLHWKDEWSRWEKALPYLKDLKIPVSADTYHPETIFELVKFWQDHRIKVPLIWNDVSGKFDESVKEFLKTGHEYVFCHSLVPHRELSGRHMDYSASEIDLFEYFAPHHHPQVIFDPALGFSKTYEQNWNILENFNELSRQLNSRWLLGFSRKSFLRKKYPGHDRDSLDRVHTDEVIRLFKNNPCEVWIRTHRPELFPI